MKRFLCVFFLTVLLTAAGPALADRLITKATDSYFATASVLSLYTDDASFAPVWQETKELLAQIEQCVSVAVPDSDVSRFNGLAAGESCAISDVTAAIFRQACQIHDQTDGLFDPTVYPLVDLWGFSPRFNTNLYSHDMPYDREYREGVAILPDEGYINAFLPLVGLDGIELSGGPGCWVLTKHTPDVDYDGRTWHAMLDLGGIAKGYACDQVNALLRSYGFSVGYFTCGGSSMTILNSRSADGAYAMTIHKPRTGENSKSTFASVRVSQSALSTSSDYSHCHMIDGSIYSHIIDPRTGWPVNRPDANGTQHGIISVTILDENAALSDALTTALMLMGPEAAPAYLAQHPETRYVIVVDDGGDDYVVLSSIPEASLSLTDTRYIRRDIH